MTEVENMCLLEYMLTRVDSRERFQHHEFKIRSNTLYTVIDAWKMIKYITPAQYNELVSYVRNLLKEG